jgi:diguanylate cyclase (GGDEF)-like protein
MFWGAKMSIQRNVGAFFLVLAILVGGTWTTVRITTDHLLYSHATSTANSWAHFLAASITDFKQIAGGELPSNESMAFLQSARQSGEVFRYVIFNREGYSQLVSDRDRIALINLSELDADAARAADHGKPIVNVMDGDPANQPTFFARAYVPVPVDGRPVAVVAAFIDETAQRDDFNKTFLIAAGSLCMLMALAFAIPAIAWYRRTLEKQGADRRIRFLAHHDALTGLSNRPSLIEKLEKLLADRSSQGGNLAAYFIDLDHFKEVNDTLGHDGGDYLLKTIAERLHSVIRAGDVVARFGGDEFVLIQSGINTRNEAEAFANRLTAALTASINFKKREIVATFSVGIALAPDDGGDSERLLKSADLALYKAKADGRNCIRFFLPEMDAELQARLDLETTIREASLHDRFMLHYQPLFEISDRRLIGFEALLRLPAKDGTLIPPTKFIPVAQSMRLIDKIGAWVLMEACRTAASWPEHLTIAVNLSPAQFQAGTISRQVAVALEETGLAAHRLELEITESLLLDDSEAVMAQLQALKQMGVAIVMDDFGTGYSSLSYLWRFPFDKIKIDRSFMEGFGDSRRHVETVVKTIVALGRELNMRVTVEGVETAKQADFLDKAHGDQAQGYYFGRPMPASDVAANILSDFQRRQALTPEAGARLQVVK